MRAFAPLLPCLLLTACGGSAPPPAAPPAAEAPSQAMAREHRHDTPTPTAVTEPDPRVPVAAGDVEYTPGTRGYAARPQATPRPATGLIVIHEWWGLNDNIRAVTRRLAGEGHHALAVDLYRGDVASDPAAARPLMERAGADEPGVHAQLRAAAEYLARQGVAKIGVIGWCFGGGWALKAALLMPDRIDAVVMYYGHPVTDRAQLQRLDAPLLGHFGAADTGIPLDQVRLLESTLRELGKTATIHVYDGAGHAFANPSGGRYVPEAAETSWQRTTEFLAARLR